MENNAQKFDSVEQKNTAEGLSKEELGRLVASRWTGENPNEPSPQENDVDDEQLLCRGHVCEGRKNYKRKVLDIGSGFCSYRQFKNN